MAGEHDPALVGEVAALLFDVVERARQVYHEAYRAEGLTELQWLVLRRLRQEREAPPIGQLAAWLDTEPPTVTALVDRLQARSLLERRADAADRRVRRIHLTEAAHAMLERIDTRAAGESPCRDLEAGELARLRDLLVRMRRG